MWGPDAPDPAFLGRDMVLTQTPGRRSVRDRASHRSAPVEAKIR